MRIAGMIQDSIVDGPGFRFTLFAQGCPHRCAGCHNPETHDPEGGIDVSVEEIIGEMLKNPLTDGLTLSGGEPFFQAGDCAKIAAAAGSAGLNVWTYTGYTFEELLAKAREDTDVAELMRLTDTLIDGPFILEQRSLTMKWRGSKNQRVLDMKKSLAGGRAAEIDI